MAPPCAAGKPRSPRSSVSVDSDGIRIITGEAVILEWEYLERDDLGVSPPGGRPFALDATATQ